MNIGRWANLPETQIGRIPERLGKASVLVDDALELMRHARREWVEAD